jgi:hypothetical protein
VSGLSSTVNSLALAASLSAATAAGESGDFATISVATLPAAARNRWRLGSVAPFARSAATARLTNRPGGFGRPPFSWRLLCFDHDSPADFGEIVA